MQGSQASTYHLRRVALGQLEPSIPARYYYDPQHYVRELEVFWYGMWVLAGREEEVPEPRDYKVLKVGTQSIVVLRDLDGQLRAFHNTCRHRGSILCTEEQGRLPGRRLVCPYHTWTYSLDGQLRGTPDFAGVSNFDRAANGLVPIPVATWEQFVFLRLDAEGPSVEEFLGDDLLAQFRALGLAGFHFMERRRYAFECNWKVFVDNYLDGGYHIPCLHKGLNSVLDYSEY
ncbi:MAG: aromatic ring-hydroxylating oxygenase subunit alpha, partial [Actinomycetota bacterium]